MAKIIVIEDNKNLREELIDFLARYGYEAYGPSDFKYIVNDVLKSDADLIMLDINLPFYDGYYICREIRKVKNTPIIVVTSRDSDMDEVMSMNLGADDFITKPYNTEVLLARIASLLRRVYGNTQEIIEYKGLKLNIASGSLVFESKEMDLTKNEAKIAHCLMKNKGAVVTREDLMDYLWNSDLYVDDNTLSVNITRLRKKLQELGFKDAIETKRGIGYMLP